jgi:cellulose synthase operon protein C
MKKPSSKPFFWALALGFSTPVFAQNPPTSPPTNTSLNAGKCGKKGAGIQTPRPTAREEIPSDPRLLEVYEARKRFEEAAAEYRGDIHELITGQYLTRKQSMLDGYDKDLNRKQQSEENLRAGAIIRFESFVEKYPEEAKYTPGALYRLAELYFERDNIAYLNADAAYQERLAQIDKGIVAPELAGDLPLPDYTATINTFERLINGFSDYENLDGALYLQAYCLSEMTATDQSLERFKMLVERFPNSRFAPEAHLRFGEAQFGLFRYDDAIREYKSVVDLGEGPYYDKALYKLAWSHYRRGLKNSTKDPIGATTDFVDSIKGFKTLLDYNAAGKGGGVLKQEALQYLEIDLAEDWNGDGVPDWTIDESQKPINRVKRYLDLAQPYTQEVIVGTANNLFGQRLNKEAIELYVYAVDSYPTNPDNPTLLGKVVEAYEREDLPDEALAMREEIGRRFGKGSEWASAQDEAIQEAASALAEDAIIRSATKHHERGQSLRALWETEQTPELLTEWQKEYRLAADGYRSYLRDYATSENAYELGFYYAECLFYSSRFLDAAEQYEKIRDSNTNDLYFEDAAYSAIVGVENEIKVQDEAGTFKFRASPPEKASGEEPQEFPALVARLQKNRDIFIDKISVPCSADIRMSDIKYSAALTLFNYGQFSEARRRFDAIIVDYPNNKVALDAAKLLVDSYRLEGDLLGQKQAADKYFALNLGPVGVKDPAVEDQKFTVDYQYALQLFSEEKFDQAAELLVSLIERRPDWELKTKAMNDAAVSFERAKRFDSATKYFEKIYKESPDSEFAPNAVYRVGINASRFFEFDKAVSAYLLLLTKYKTKFDEELLLGALLEVAQIKENNREWADSAKYYEQAHDQFLNTKVKSGNWDPSAALFKVADVRKKGALYDPAIQGYKRFLGVYSDKAHASRAIEANFRIAEIWITRGKRTDALKAYKATVDIFDALVIAPGGPGSDFAAQAAIELIEDERKTYESINLKIKDPKKAEKAITAKLDALKALKKKYEEIIGKYRSADWSLAASFKIGALYENLAEAFYASNPYKQNTLEYDDYQVAIEQFAIKNEDEAIKFYKAVHDKGKELKIDNEWTKLALAKLNKFKGSQEYPLPKPPKTKIEESTAITAGVK